MDNKIFCNEDYINLTFPSPLNLKGLRVGKIKAIKDDEFLLVDIEPTDGGIIENIGWFGGTYDNETENYHGFCVPPRIGALVLFGFIDGSANKPNVIAQFEFPSDSTNKTIARYNGTANKNEIRLGHFSGTLITLKENGEVKIEAGEITQENGENKYSTTLEILKDGTLNIDSTKININGSTKGIARKGDFVGSYKSRTGEYYFDWLQKFVDEIDNIVSAIQNSPTTPTDGGASFKAGLVSTITPSWEVFKTVTPTPESLISEITSASTTLKTD